MKSIINRLLNIPTKYTIVACLGLILIISMIAQGEITSFMAFIILCFAASIILYMHYGSVVIKAVLAIFAVMYMSSMYTSLVVLTDDKVIEPFLLSLASATIFLATTYNNKKYNYGLRSRPLWTTLMTILIISTKITIVYMGFSFMIAEVIGLNVLIILTSLWLYWTNTSKKTKIVEPEIVEVKDIENLRFIHMKNTFNLKDKKWINTVSKKDNNAYPYIFNEVLKAREENKHLVLTSTLKTSKEYDVGKVVLNKSKEIPYLYIEAKENMFSEEIIEKFIEEISRAEH